MCSKRKQVAQKISTASLLPGWWKAKQSQTLTSRFSEWEQGSKLPRESRGQFPRAGNLAPQGGTGSSGPAHCPVEMPLVPTRLITRKGVLPTVGLGAEPARLVAGLGLGRAWPQGGLSRSAGSSRRKARKRWPPHRAGSGQPGRASQGRPRGPCSLSRGSSSALGTCSRWTCWSSVATRSRRAARVCSCSVLEERSSWGLHPGSAPPPQAEAALGALRPRPLWGSTTAALSPSLTRSPSSGQAFCGRPSSAELEPGAGQACGCFHFLEEPGVGGGGSSIHRIRGLHRAELGPQAGIPGSRLPDGRWQPQ